MQCGERLLSGQLLAGDGRSHGSRDFDPDFERAVSLGEYGGALCGVIRLIVRAAVKRLPQSFEIASGLKRQRPTHSQVGLTREERVAKLRDAFRVTNPERVKGRTVIVVDDVMAVGTTVFECARVLKKAGAERVWAATVARTLKSVVLPQPAECGKQEEYEAAEKAVSV